MNNSFRENTILKNTTILECLRIIDKTKKNFLIVLDKTGVLIGIITEGEIRRLILKGLSLADNIIYNNKFICINQEDSFLKLFEYFKNKYSNLKNIVFFTGSYNQEKVNEFTSWALIGDLFASMTEEDMFKTSNKNVIPFKLSTDKLNIGISYSHGTLDNIKESAHVLQIKEKRGVPQEWFVENLVNKGYNVVDYTYNTKIDTIKGYQHPKDFMETYNNLKKENINLVVKIGRAHV